MEGLQLQITEISCQNKTRYMYYAVVVVRSSAQKSLDENHGVGGVTTFHDPPQLAVHFEHT